MADYGYTKDGKKVLVNRKLSDTEYLVQDVISVSRYYGEDYEDGEEISDSSYIVSAVYETAPTEVLDARVSELTKQIEALESQKNVIRSAIQKEQSEYEQRKAKITAIPELRRLEDFISGKITHYVLSQRYDYPSILAFSDTVSEYSQYERGMKRMKMLSLYGKSDGNLEWGLSSYSDGAGSDSTVIPCCSLEEAKDVLQGLFDKLFVEKTSKELLNGAAKQDIAIPDWYIEKVRQQEIDNAKHSVKKAEAALESAKKSLEEVSK